MAEWLDSPLHRGEWIIFQHVGGEGRYGRRHEPVDACPDHFFLNQLKAVNRDTELLPGGGSFFHVRK